MPSPNPPPANLILPHPVYNEFELDPRDPFYDIPRGGQPLADDEFYMKSRAVREGGRLTGSKHSYSVLVRGLDISLRQLWMVNNAIRQECMEPKMPTDFLHTRSPQNKARLWAIRVKLLKQFSFLKLPFNHKIYGWWAHDALLSWCSASIRELAQNPLLATASIDNIRHFDQQIDLPRPMELQRPSIHHKYELKDCFLRFSDPIGTVKYIPFTAIMTLPSPDASDLYLGTTDISVLHETPDSEFGIGEPSETAIKYLKRSTIGFVEEKTVVTSEDLRSAIMDLWKDGQRVFDLKVEPVEEAIPIKQEAREDEESTTTKKGKKSGSKKRKVASQD